jgi:glycerol-3-phosphate dehydrogenase (NAD(P)+)
VGLALGRGARPEDNVPRMNEVAEGVRTTQATCALAEIHGVEMPISQAVKQVLDGDLEPRQAVERLLSRQLRNENE